MAVCITVHPASMLGVFLMVCVRVSHPVYIDMLGGKMGINLHAELKLKAKITGQPVMMQDYDSRYYNHETCLSFIESFKIYKVR